MKRFAAPIDYGGLELKNRIIFAPTTFGMQKMNILQKSKELRRADAR